MAIGTKLGRLALRNFIRAQDINPGLVTRDVGGTLSYAEGGGPLYSKLPATRGRIGTADDSAERIGSPRRAVSCGRPCLSPASPTAWQKPRRHSGKPSDLISHS